jgi:flagellar basal-body rod protein FlgB
MVNGRLMANALFCRFNRSLTIRPAKSADLARAGWYPLRPGMSREGPMSITDLPLFSMLRTRMQWHQERQRLLSENVANADTPSYRPRDLAPLQFDRRTASILPVALERTSNAHLGAAAGASDRFEASHFGGYDVHPTGNAVNLEDEMIKVAANQMDYQAATTLYTRSLGLIKTAIGKK